MSERDQIFSEELERISGFSFDDRVAQVFPDMINRSVPGYKAIVAMTGQLAGHYAKPGASCYDLGCSRGASTLAMASNTPDDCKIIAVDNSKAMIDLLQEDLKKSSYRSRVELHHADILEEKFANSSFTAMNFTLQFVDPAQRDRLIRQIYTGLNPGGALLLSEKIRFEDVQMDNLMTELYYDYKRTQGYSDLEISQKRSALENVLVAETRDTHLERLQRAGFSRAAVWFQCLNFCSFLAIRA
jgi:tRNA (cmo5U34)-methyltransferase